MNFLEAYECAKETGLAVVPAAEPSIAWRADNFECSRPGSALLCSKWFMEDTWVHCDQDEAWRCLAAGGKVETKGDHGWAPVAIKRYDNGSFIVYANGWGSPVQCKIGRQWRRLIEVPK